MRISVVMASYNQGPHIREALESALTQNDPDFEVIVIDGGSTDETLAILDAYRDRLAYYVSEPDAGQSHALNKGFEAARGDLLTWLNTDDAILPGALRRVRAFAERYPKCEWFAGDTVNIDPEGRIFQCCRGTRIRPYLWRSGLMGVGGPSAFFSADLFRRAGALRTDMHYMFDGELWTRFFQLGARFLRIPHYLWCFRWHKDSKTTHQAFEDPSADRPTAGADPRCAERAMFRSMHFAGVSPGRRSISRLLEMLDKVVCGKAHTGLWDTWKLKGKRWQEAFPVLNGE